MIISLKCGRDYYCHLSLVLNKPQVLKTSKPQRLFQMRGQKMDQTKFLSQTLWQFVEASAFTDLTLVCKDGEVAVHSPMLASLLLKIGFSCLSADQERPECLLMPDSRSLSCSHSFSSSDVISNLSTLCLILNMFVFCSCHTLHW